MTFAPTNQVANTIITNARNNRKSTVDPHTIEEPFLIAFLHDLGEIDDKQSFFNTYYSLIIKPLMFTNPLAKILWWATKQTCDAIERKNEDLGRDNELSVKSIKLWINSTAGLKQDIFSGQGSCKKAPENITKAQVIEYIDHLLSKQPERTALECLEWWQAATADKKFLQELAQIQARLDHDGNLITLSTALTSLKHEVDSIMRVPATTTSISLQETSKEHIANVLKQSSSTANFIPTADREMNEKIFGFARGDLSLITARPNHGKSMHSLRHAYAAFASGKRIFYLSLEMPEKKIIRELMTIASHISKQEMTSLTSEIERDELVDKFYNQVTTDAEKGGKFIYQVVKNISFKEMFDIIETHLEYMGFDIVFIDLLDYVQVPDRAENLHGQGGYFDTQLGRINAMALKYNCAIVGVVQMKTDAILNGKVQGVEAIGHSASYGRMCNFALHYERPSDEYEGVSYYQCRIIKDREMGQLNKAFIYSIDTDNKRTRFRPDIKDMEALERKISKQRKDDESKF